MKSTYNIGKIFGIQFRLHYSWFLIFLLVTVFLSWQVFPFALEGESWWLYVLMGSVTSLFFFASVLTHELAHSLVARSKGIPIHGITLFIFGGAAQMTREASRASDELKLALAGPATSILIATFFGFIYISLNGISDPLALMAYWLAYINVILAVFNLLPGFPLDGGRVLRATIWHFSGNYMKATRYATQSGRVIGYLLIAGGFALMFFNENLISGIWLIFIGWFLANTAQMSYRQARMQEVLRGFKASQVMITDCPVVDGNTEVAVLKDQYTAGGSHCFFISEADRAVGFVTSHNIEAVSPQERGTTRLRDIAIPLDMSQAANPDQDVLSIVQQMNEKNINQVPVISGGQLVGLIILDDVIQFVTSHSPLKMMQRR